MIFKTKCVVSGESESHRPWREASLIVEMLDYEFPDYCIQMMPGNHGVALRMASECDERWRCEQKISNKRVEFISARSHWHHWWHRNKAIIKLTSRKRITNHVLPAQCGSRNSDRNCRRTVLAQPCKTRRLVHELYIMFFCAKMCDATLNSKCA